MHHLRDRMDALTLVLKSCEGHNCTQPWEALHPDGTVRTLKEALDPKYDNFYKNQPKVKFHQCAKGYIKANEKPFVYDVYGQSQNALRRMSPDVDESMGRFSPEIEDRDIEDDEDAYDPNDFTMWGDTWG